MGVAMNALPMSSLSGYWAANVVTSNLIVFLNLFGALLLGLLVGYERSYRGRAAGMRTYGLVCMASAGLTVICAFPQMWFGTHWGMQTVTDPTRVFQGIVTGIGFLGAGVIMREGFNISGLTTAASIWSSSVIGIMIGVGFYGAAIALALLSMSCMMWVSRLEGWLPSRPAMAISLQFRRDFYPTEAALRQVALDNGYEIAGGSLRISSVDGRQEWQFVAVSLLGQTQSTLAEMAAKLEANEGVERYQLSHARN